MEAANTQQLLLVDEQDRFIGRYVGRGEAHSGEGAHHRAFVLMVLNTVDEILLQRRKHWLWDNLWDLSAVSHVLHLAEHDESYAEAAARALSAEMDMQIGSVQQMGGFNYFAQHFDGVGCENEYCAILLTQADGEPRPNREAVYEYRWLGLDLFRADVQEHGDSYTPWARLAVETLVAQGDWPPNSHPIRGRSRRPS